MFVLPDLPYGYDALSPVISDRTLHFHHDKHHAAYVKTTNELLEAAGKTPQTLEQVIQEASKAGDHKLFNNAAQAWNHSFFWAGMSPGREQPEGGLATAIDSAFGGLDKLKETFVKEGVGHFGSGARQGVTPRLAATLRRRILEGGECPVRQGVEPRLQEGFSVVLVVEVVGVLPQVADQQRRDLRLGHRVVRVVGRSHLQGAATVGDQPHPA